MKLALKAYIAAGLFFVFFVLIGSISLWGVSRLSGILDYVVGPAWTTADGAMEGTIGLQSELLSSNDYLKGDQEAAGRIAEAKKTATDAIDRLIAAKIIQADQVEDLQAYIDEYETAQSAAFTAYDSYQKKRTDYQQQVDEFVQLGEVLEERGDAAVEDLTENPLELISWSTGLQDKWEAADGGMEANIGFLTSLFHLRRYLTGEPDAETLAQVQDALAFQKEAADAMLATGYFDIAAPAPFSGSMKSAYREHYAEYEQNIETLVGSYNVYYTALQAYNQAAQTLIEYMETFEELGDSAVESQTDAVISTQENVTRAVLVALFFGLVAIAGLALMIRINLVKPINRLIERTADIAHGEGDLTKRLNIQGRSELAELSQHFDSFMGKLQGIISDTKQSCDVMSGAIEQSNKTSHAIADKTQEVNDLSTMVAAANEELEATAAEIAQRCAQASSFSDSVSTLTQDGHKTVSDVDSGMGRIVDTVTQSSTKIQALKSQADRIGEIVSVIAGISEKTNLLALNAAIEAARAGEQGRGFAVVADEVRTLAQSTANATTETEKVIELIQAETNAAYSAMQQCESEVTGSQEKSKLAQQALVEISTNIQELTDLISQIAVSAEEQTSTIGDINNKFVAMNENIKDVSEGMEANRESADQIQLNTNSVNDKIAIFKL